MSPRYEVRIKSHHTKPWIIITKFRVLVELNDSQINKLVKHYGDLYSLPFSRVNIRRCL